MALIDEIRTKAAALLAQRDTVAIAAKVSAGRTAIVSRPIGNGTVLETLGADRGAVVLSNLSKMGGSDARCLVAVKMLDAATFDVGSATTRAMIDEMSTKVVTLLGGPLLKPEEALALKALAEQAAPVYEFDVRRACWSDDGKWIP
jgi:predicted dienelactone hydrolase